MALVRAAASSVRRRDDVNYRKLGIAAAEAHWSLRKINGQVVEQRLLVRSTAAERDLGEPSQAMGEMVRQMADANVHHGVARAAILSTSRS